VAEWREDRSGKSRKHTMGRKNEKKEKIGFKKEKKYGLKLNVKGFNGARERDSWP
jgi:hypothetical protein